MKVPASIRTNPGGPSSTPSYYDDTARLSRLQTLQPQHCLRLDSSGHRSHRAHTPPVLHPYPRQTHPHRLRIDMIRWGQKDSYRFHCRYRRRRFHQMQYLRPHPHTPRGLPCRIPRWCTACHLCNLSQSDIRALSLKALMARHLNNLKATRRLNLVPAYA